MTESADHSAIFSESSGFFDEQDPRPVPAYQRVKSFVHRRIASGAWAEGVRIPSENELVETTGFSRMTINRAYRELADDGVITRIAGVGSFVADTRPASALLEVRSIADEISARGHTHRADVIVQRREPDASRPECADLRGHDGSVFHVVIVHYDDDVPAQVEDRFVHPDFAPQLLEQDFTTRTTHSYLTSEAPITRGQHVVEAVLPTAHEARQLAIAITEPCLLVQRRTWSGNTLISYARLQHPGTRRRLEGSFEQPS